MVVESPSWGHFHVQAGVPWRLLFYWRSCWRFFDQCLSGTGSLRSAFLVGGVSGGGALPSAPSNGVSSSSKLCCAVLEVTFQITPKFPRSQKQPSPDCSPGFRQSDRSTSVMESLWGDGSYTGEWSCARGWCRRLEVIIYHERI